MLHVIDLMTPIVITIEPTDSLAYAIRIMEKAKIRHLVAIDEDGKPIGILSDRDCRLALSSPYAIYNEEKAASFAQKIQVDQILTRNPVTIAPDALFTEAIDLLLKNQFHALPVVEGNRVVGIITSTDLLRLLQAKPDLANRGTKASLG